MSEAMHAYPEYKDSGLPWLGRIPKHWDCLPHRAIFEEVKEQGHVDEQLLSVTIGKGIIRQENLLADSSKKDSSNLDKSKYKLVEPGDIAYNKMRAWQGAVGVSRYRGIVSPAYIVQRLRGESRPEYFHYLFRTPGFAKEAERWSYGITSDQWSLRPQHFKMIYSCVPPLDEQGLIVGFLRGLDRQVRRFIRNRWRLIETLNEQKQAIINRAVTQGLAPNVPLKPSGIDWLGDIPKHWKVFRLRNLTELRTSNVDKHTKPGETPVRLCNYTDVYKNAEITINMPFMKATASPNEIRLFSLKVGDVLITKDSEDWADIGVPAVVSGTAGDLVCGYHLAILRPKPHVISGRFLGFALRSQAASTQLSVSSKGVTRYGLSQGAIKDLLIAVPPKNEQLRLVQHIQTEIKSLRRAINRAQQEIDLIREYRTRLISDVVTGKVDVRHLAPPPGSEYLEEMVEELEPLDDAAGELEDEALAGEVSRAD